MIPGRLRSALRAATPGPAIAIALAVAVAGAPACSAERDTPAPARGEAQPRSATRLADPSEASDLIGPELLVALAQAKNFHHKARVYMTDGNLAAATASVRQILSLAFPRGAPEADDVRNDARALLAKLLVSQGQLDEADRAISEGLAQSQRESFFVANLYTVQGEIHQARATALDAGAESDKAAARDERRAAIAAFDHSIKINERLQKKLMEEP